MAGIDVSKGKSTVSILRPFGEVVAKPFIQAVKNEASEEKAPKQTEKKPSVLAKLHPAVSGPTKTAPTKSAERER